MDPVLEENYSNPIKLKTKIFQQLSGCLSLFFLIEKDYCTEIRDWNLLTFSKEQPIPILPSKNKGKFFSKIY